MKNLAIGFRPEFGFDWSVHVRDNISAIGAAKTLSDAARAASCCGASDDGLWPSQILMIGNGPDGPVAFDRYIAGVHYPHSEHADFVSWEENHVTSERLGTHQSPIEPGPSI